MQWMRRWTGFIAGATVGVMVIWFVGTAVSSRINEGQVAGWLFGKPVSVQDYEQTLHAVTHNEILSRQDKSQKKATQQELESRAWERLLFLKEAKQKKIQVSDQEVIDHLKQWSAFSHQGQFDHASYEMFATYTLGTSTRAFEEEIRQDLMINKLWEQALGRNSATDSELKEQFHRKEDAIQISVLPLPNEKTAQEIADVAQQKPAQLDKIAQHWKLKLIRSDFFNRSETLPDIGNATTFERLFELEPGQVAGPFSTTHKGWVAARLETKRPADEEKIPALRENLEKEVVNQKKMRAYFAWMSDLHKRAQLSTGPQRKSSRPTK